MIPPPPTSTLFPYTTLFRSRPHRPRLRRERILQGRQVPLRDGKARVFVAATRGSFRDRKSTRLNSSHVEISYAVFCLKKKSRINEYVDDLNNYLSVGTVA